MVLPEYTLEDLYGGYETQSSEGGEADLHKHLTGCKKNPGHVKFIPVETFKLEHLPEGYHDQDLYDLIKAVADLTVRVDVRLTSEDRPEFWPDKNYAYPFYSIRGKDILRTGSGRVSHITEYKSCPCQKCLQSDEPNKVWWEVIVQTATHVVYDKAEASHTKFRLFYDRQDSPVITLGNVSVCDSYLKRDQCYLACVTCDADLGSKVYDIKTRLDVLWRKVHNKYKQTRDIHKLTFIVSHPHGCPKHISIGRWVEKYHVTNFVCKFSYTTSTCPGSSGAYVNIVGYDTCPYQPVHSGTLANNINYSGSGIII
uniref:Uncharacterized protein n=1 Tax=Biomphalaria glabrata TaxID=6526 RepID=A0A2C9LP40_BIOGL